MSPTSAPVAVVEVRDLHGRSYRVGERPHDIMGHSRKWMLWLSWAAMAGIGVLQYGYGVAVTALHATNGSNVTGALWVLALWVVFQAGAAAPTAALSHRFALAPSRAVLVGALLCAAGPLTLAYTDSLALAVLGYSVLCGTGAGIVYATCTSTVAKWYPEERAVRVGFVTGAFGYGAVPFIVLFAAGLTPGNRAEIFAVVGVCVLVVVAVCGVLLRDPPAGLVATRDRPQTVGRRQAGEPQPAQQRPSGAAVLAWGGRPDACVRGDVPHPGVRRRGLAAGHRVRPVRRDVPRLFARRRQRRRLVCSLSSTARAAASPVGSPTDSGDVRR